VAYRITETLQNSNALVKDLVLKLSYSQSKRQPLTSKEVHFTKEKCILGSISWITTLALLHIQQDPLEDSKMYKKSLAPMLEETATKSIDAYNHLLHALHTIDCCRTKTVQFVQTTFFSFARACAKPNSSLNQMFNLHKLRKLKKSLPVSAYQSSTPISATDSSFKSSEDSSNDSGDLQQFIQRQPMYDRNHYYRSTVRILYKPNDLEEPCNWLGFDNSDSAEKFRIINLGVASLNSLFDTMIADVKSLREAYASKVMDLISRLDKEFRQLTNAKLGLISSETNNLLEVIKILLDWTDMLTLGANTLRLLYSEARHIIHICYVNIRRAEPNGWVKWLLPYSALLGKVRPKDVNEVIVKQMLLYDIRPERIVQVENMILYFQDSDYANICKEIPVTFKEGQTIFQLQLQ